PDRRDPDARPRLRQERRPPPRTRGPARPEPGSLAHHRPAPRGHQPRVRRRAGVVRSGATQGASTNIQVRSGVPKPARREGDMARASVLMLVVGSVVVSAALAQMPKEDPARRFLRLTPAPEEYLLGFPS